jgi:arylsulfatase A-like enzyme
MSESTEASSVVGVCSIALCCVVATAGVEAVRAATACALAHAGVRIAALGALEAFGTVALPLTVLALLVGALLGRAEVRKSVSAWSTAIVGDATRAPLVIVGVPLAVLGFAVGAAATLGNRAGAIASTRVAVSVTIVTTLATLLGSTLVATWLVTRLAPIFTRLAARSRLIRFASTGAIAALACGVIATMTLSALVPMGMLPTAVPAMCVLAACVWRPVRVRLARAFAGLRFAIATTAIVASGVGAFGLLGTSPPLLRLVVLYRAPIAGPIALEARTLVDHDHDGYSPILAGGDCDDHNSAIHPKAHDTPGNGVDENCSGADAKPFVPRPQPTFEPLSGLPQRPNIVLVHIDALRPDHLGFAGYGRKTSPNLDAFRANATWFSRAYTPAPSTRFAMAALFTGVDVERLPQKREHGNEFVLLPGVPTIAGRLGSLGYDRVGYTISYVLQHIKGVGDGFRVWDTPWRQDDWEKSEPRAATHTTDAALDYLERAVGDAAHPYLLFLHYRCTHDPYSPDPRWRFGSSAVDEYDSALAYCDDEIGRLLRALELRTDRDRTAILFYSDHGELFGEHGYEHHGNSLLEPDVRVLLLARIPGILPVHEVSVPVTLLDLAPTLQSLAGAAADAAEAGWNLVPMLARGDGAGDAERPIFLYTEHLVGAVRHEATGVVVDHMKYIRDYTTSTTQLFDLWRDPREEHDIPVDLPEIRERLAALLDSWEQSTKK